MGSARTKYFESQEICWLRKIIFSWAVSDKNWLFTSAVGNTMLNPATKVKVLLLLKGRGSGSVVPEMAYIPAIRVQIRLLGKATSKQGRL